MFKIYSSSAGSGKTYTLTKEYLKLALSGDSDSYFRHILAVTFTNAAATEMKERILSTLRLFSTSKGENHPMLRDVVQELFPETKLDENYYREKVAFISEKSKAVFKKLLHRYSDFSVMTIDKFTQRLVSSFTEELGLPFTFETQLDSDLLESAVDVLLARIGQEGEELLTRIVENYYRETVNDGKSWGALPLRIREAAYDLLNEQSYLSLQKVKELEMEDWMAIRSQLRQFIQDKEAEMTEYALTAFSRIEEDFLAEKDFHRGSQGIHKFFQDRKEKRKLWDSPNSYVVKTIEEDQWHGTKSTAYVKEKIDAIKDELESCFLQIEETRLRFSDQAVLYRLLEKHLYNLSLLGEIRKEFDLLLRQNNQVHISDFNRKVMEIVSREPIPFIFERLGEKYNHILVDEFQDTSKLQFANLLPLLDNALAEGNFNLIVGDAKQSIYRFRGGDMDLILHLSKNNIEELANALGNGEFTNERLLGITHFLQTDHLRTNRRSFREITEFNNTFFCTVADGLKGTTPLASLVFDENFQQEIPENVKEGGHVQVELIDVQLPEGTDSTALHDPIGVRTLELIMELRAKGYDWRDIAILSRKKKEAANLATVLKEAGIPLISDDSLLLTNARSVSLLIAFMKVFQASDNRLARYEAAYLFHCIVKEEVPTATQHEAIRQMCGEKDLGGLINYIGSQGSELNMFRLRHLGVYEFCEQLIASFHLFEYHSETQYLFRFLDVILDFGTRRSNHLADFLTYWETARTKFSITLPANSNAVRITTIHKSKGLEYPVVLIPYAHWVFTPSPLMDKVWLDLDELDYEELVSETESGNRKLVSSVAGMVKDLGETAVGAQYEEEKNRILLENLNLVYVAFTRPIQRLYILAKEEKNWEKVNSRVNRWLYDYLITKGQLIEPGKSVYVVSEGNSGVFHSAKESSEEEFKMEEIISNDRTSSLRLRRLAERIFDVETFEKKEDNLSKIRYALTRIEQPESIPVVVEQLSNEGVIGFREKISLEESLQKLVSKDELKDLFIASDKKSVKADLLLPGGQITGFDRIITKSDGTRLIVNFVAGSGNESARGKMRKLINQYQAFTTSTEVKGALVYLANDTIEWFEGKEK